MESATALPKLTFTQFYRDIYLPEHRHPANVALHVFGTVAALVFAIWIIIAAPVYWLVLFPLVHALPGLLGHWLLERNPDVGDTRLLRKDAPLHWFIVANHLLLLRLITGRGH